MRLVLVLPLLSLACAHAKAPPARAASTDELYGARLARDREQLRRPESRTAARADLEAAQQELEARTAAHPEDPRAHFWLARTLINLEQLEPALTELEKASLLAPRDSETLYLKGFVLNRQHQPERAVQVLEDASKLAPRDAHVLSELGAALAADGKEDRAAEVLGQALALDPKNSEAMGSLASIRLGQGRQDEALELFERASAIDPDLTFAHFNAGLLLQLRGEAEKARPHFEAVVRLEPDSPAGHAKLVQTYQALGLLKERDAEREKVLELNRAGKGLGEEFCREQFRAGDKWVMANERYAFEGDQPERYRFYVLPEPTAKKPLFFISLGSDDWDNRLARKSGELGPEERIYELEVYSPDGGHSTYGIYNRKEPSYEEVRALVADILSGKARPVSGRGKGKNARRTGSAAR